MMFWRSEKTGETFVIDDTCFRDEFDTFDVTMLIRPIDTDAVACHLTYNGWLSSKRRDWVESLPEQGDRDVMFVSSDGLIVTREEMIEDMKKNNPYFYEKFGYIYEVRYPEAPSS